VKKNILVLVTYEYPFGTSETFLETEIDYLSKGFKEVHVIPSRAAFNKKWIQGSKKLNRSIPENCTIILPQKDSFITVLKFINSSCSVLSSLSLSDIISDKNIRKLLFNIRDSIKGALFLSRYDRYFVNKGKIQLAYSYWKGISTLCLLKLKKRGILQTVISRTHGGDLYHANDYYKKYLIDNCDFIIPISQHGAKFLINSGFNKNKIYLSRLGVSPPQNYNEPSCDNVFRLVSCSNIIEVKRVDILAEALLQVKNSFHWTHFGDGNEKEKVLGIVKSIPKNGKVSMLGRIPNSEVLKYYKSQRVDLFVNVSSSEGLSVSIMEASIHGIPVIATDVGGTSDLVNSQNGELLSENITSAELASIISQIIQDKPAILKKRRMAMEISNTLVNADVNYSAFVEFLQSL